MQNPGKIISCANFTKSFLSLATNFNPVVNFKLFAIIK